MSSKNVLKFIIHRFFIHLAYAATQGIKIIYYMFCLYHFSVKCIIKKNYLQPYGLLQLIFFQVIFPTSTWDYSNYNRNFLNRTQDL